jgi:uncharacterized membrane protein YozB (DUF420 family)
MTDLFLPASDPVATVLLTVELVIAVLLVVGMFAVRRGHVRAHMLIQSSMVLVNIPVILVLMLPTFQTDVLPGLPGDVGQAFYLWPTLMAFAGVAAEALGVYIILVAGTNLLPDRLRFRRYKLWMRSELILWWIVVLAGVATYYYWWVASLPA